MKINGTYHHGQHRSLGNIAPCCETKRDKPMSLSAQCPECQEWVEGLLDYENHCRSHENDNRVKVREET